MWPGTDVPFTATGPQLAGSPPSSEVAARTLDPVEQPTKAQVRGMRDRSGVDMQPVAVERDRKGGGCATGLGVVLGMFGDNHTLR